MKRVTSSCLFQTLHFVLDPHYSKEEALDKVKKEVEDYKNQDSSIVRIISEEVFDNGSVILKIKKELVDILLANILNKSF